MPFQINNYVEDVFKKIKIFLKFICYKQILVAIRKFAIYPKFQEPIYQQQICALKYIIFVN